MTVAPVVESGAPPPEPPSEADPANRWVVAIAAAALIAMLAAVAWWATSGRLRFALRSAGRSSIDALAPWRPMPRARIAGATAMLVLVAALAYTQPGGDGADVAADLGGDERTTVDDRQPPTSSGPGGQAASVGPPTAGGAASSASTEGSAAGGATSTTVGASPGSEATRSGPIPIGDGAHGVTDDVVRIGLFVVDSRALDRGAAAVAGNDDAGSSAGNYQTAYDAQIAHINATGGVAGRTLEPVYYFARVEDATTASGRQRMAQEACARWTEDEPVFAMIGMSEELMFDCAARSGTPLVASFLANAYLSRARFAEMSIYWYGPSTLLTETRDTALAGFLAGHDFLGPDARVALMVEDRAMSRASASSSLRPAIEASGATVVQEIRYPDAISSPWPNYVLQMQQARATHVVFGATSGGIWPAMLLMRAAEDQRYRPRWGLGSDNVPDGLITLGNLPASQLKNVLAMGWSPLLDVGDETPQGDNGSRCAEALQSAAQPVSAGSCLEIVFFLQAALARASVLSPAGLAEGAASLGDSYTSPVTVDGRARFGAGDHEGVDVVRAVGFDPAAPGHMVYLGPPEAMPG